MLQQLTEKCHRLSLLEQAKLVAKNHLIKTTIDRRLLELKTTSTFEQITHSDINGKDEKIKIYDETSL